MESVEGSGDIIGHGDIDVLVVAGVVPVDRQAQIFGACAVDCDCIELLEGVEEMIKVVGVGVFDSEVIDDEGKCGRSRFVAPEGGGVVDGIVAVWGEVVD